MIGVLLGLGPLGLAVGTFLLEWSIHAGGDCFPDDDGVSITNFFSILVFVVASGLLVPLAKRKLGWRRAMLIGWIVSLVPFVLLAVHINTYINGLGSGCPDGYVPPPW